MKVWPLLYYLISIYLYVVYVYTQTYPNYTKQLSFHELHNNSQVSFTCKHSEFSNKNHPSSSEFIMELNVLFCWVFLTRPKSGLGMTGLWGVWRQSRKLLERIGQILFGKCEPLTVLMLEFDMTISWLYLRV